MYLLWYDDSRKPTQEKIAEAVQAYRARFKTAPNVVLTNAAELTTVEGVDVRAASYVRRSNFWVGWEELAAVGRP